MTALLLSQGPDHWWGGGIVFFFLALIIAFIVLKFVFFRGWWGYGRTWPDPNPEQILKRRLARGEISEADYQHLRDVMKD